MSPIAIEARKEKDECGPDGSPCFPAILAKE